MPQQYLICHVIFRLDYGGLENGLVNVINGMSSEKWRHMVVTLNGYSDFANRLPKSTKIIDLDKQPGADLRLYFKLWKTFRKYRPDIVHTRNLSTLEAQLPAYFAGVNFRIHGEHGRDVHDLDNTSSKYRILRRGIRPFVDRYTAVSVELTNYLIEDIKVPSSRVTRICNGVDTEKFSPAENKSLARNKLQPPFEGKNRIIFGTIGRMQAVKDQVTLAKAFIELVKTTTDGERKFALVLVGDGPLREQALSLIQEAGLESITWLPGARDDTPEFLRMFDVFVLPSLAEGISNTILEAMASGLPVIATDVGGNSELVEENKTGVLVPRANPHALRDAMTTLSRSPEIIADFGKAGRARVCNEFSLRGMVTNYVAAYESLLSAA